METSTVVSISSVSSEPFVLSSSTVSSSPVHVSTPLSPSVSSLEPNALTLSATKSEFPILPEETEDEKLMYVAGHKKGRKLDVLVDYGASANYISQEIVRILGIKPEATSKPVIKHSVSSPRLYPSPCSSTRYQARGYRTMGR